MITTTVFKKNVLAYNDGKSIIVNQGGARSGKTYAILQLLILKAWYAEPEKPLIISVVSKHRPHLIKGAIRDFKKILEGQGWWNEDSFNKTQLVYEFPNKSIIEFFGADESSKQRGPGRSYLYINECNTVPFESYEALNMRTEICTFLDYNPVAEFWAHKLIGRPEVGYIHSTFLDSQHLLSKRIVDNIIALKETNPNGWRVYGEGLTGKLDGLIFPNVTEVEAMPGLGSGTGTQEVWGLDFGYTDPTALIHCIIKGKEIFCEEVIYESGLTKEDIAFKMENAGMKKHYDIIYADAAEPGSIEEIRRKGFNIKPCKKGPDSVLNGISKLQEYKINITTSSVNLLKDFRNYQWVEDSNGKYTEKPDHFFSHGPDSVRYAVTSLLDRRTPFIYTSRMGDLERAKRQAEESSSLPEWIREAHKPVQVPSPESPGHSIGSVGSIASVQR